MIYTPPPTMRITRLSDISELPEPQLGPMTKRLKYKDIWRNEPLKKSYKIFLQAYNAVQTT